MLLVDTNIWLAAADRRSRYHAECVRLIEAHRAALASTVPVISETAWLLLDRGGPAAQQNFVGSVATGEINVHRPGGRRLATHLATLRRLQRSRPRHHRRLDHRSR